MIIDKLYLSQDEIAMMKKCLKILVLLEAPEINTLEYDMSDIRMHVSLGSKRKKDITKSIESLKTLLAIKDN